MKASGLVHQAPAVETAAPSFFRWPASMIARIPQRLRSWRFWQVQALVLIATLSHYGIEVAGYTSPEGPFHDLAITLYIIPLLYAALNFGWEGAVMTGLWGIVLTSPSTWYWHHAQSHWASEVMQLAVTMLVGGLVAWRVDLESKQRQIAERTSARLELLNRVGEKLTATLEVEQRLPAVLELVRSTLMLESVVLNLEPRTEAREPLVLQDGAGLAAMTVSAAMGRNHHGIGGPVRVNERMLLVPLATESSVIGSLAASAPPGSVLDG